MAVITFPDLPVSSFRWRKANQAMVFRSPFGVQSVEASFPLWEAQLKGVVSYHADAHAMTVFLESLEGYRNQLALWNLAQPVPAGTMRGMMTLAADAAQGAQALLIVAASQAGHTLLAGDLLGLGAGLTQQVVRVAADAVADGSGVIAVTLGTPLRNAFATGSSVVWDKPKALFRQTATNDGIEFVPGVANGWALSLMEDWRP